MRDLHRKQSISGNRALSVLVGFALWLCHFGKAQIKGADIPFPYTNALFEQLMASGRTFAFGLFCIIAFVLIFSRRTNRLRVPFGAPSILLLINLVLVLKQTISANLDFLVGSIAALALTSIVFVSNYQSRGRSKAGEFNANELITAVFVFSILFTASNIYAYIAFPASSLDNNLRLHGFTSNPLHLAKLSVLVLPALLYFLHSNFASALWRYVSLSLIVLNFGLVYLTESRMAIGAYILVLITFYPVLRSAGALISTIIACGFVTLIAYVFFYDATFGAIAAAFIEGRTDSRSANWHLAWEVFLTDPIFGPPPNADGRYIYVENFLLAVASTSGLLGLALVVAFYSYLFFNLRALLKGVENSTYDVALASRAVAGGLAAVVAISLLEAALLGIFASWTLLAYGYLSASAGLNRGSGPSRNQTPKSRARAKRVSMRKHLGSQR